jgi:hypothetical protein
MNSWPPQFVSSIGSLSCIAVFSVVMGCGAVGSPIPPEDVGIEAKVRKQQRENTQSEVTLNEDGTSPIEEEGVELPAFYPIGTR